MADPNEMDHFLHPLEPCGTPTRPLSSNGDKVLRNSPIAAVSTNTAAATPRHALTNTSILTPMHVFHEEMNHSPGAQCCAPNTNESSSSDLSSPSGTPFRFTGFPASLPKVKPPISVQKTKSRVIPTMTPNVFQKQSMSGIEDEKLLHVDPPGTVRKRMVFAEHQSDIEEYDDDVENSIDSGLEHYKDACDVSHNTSLSSLSVDVAIRKTPARVQMRKIDGHMSPIMDDKILSSRKFEREGWLSPILSEEKQQLLDVGDEDENDVSPDDPITESNSGGMQPPLRTRLNFNAFTPNSNTDGLDRKRQSFDEFDHNDDATPARKVERKNLNGPHLFNPNRKDSSPPAISDRRFAPFQLGVSDKLSPNEENFRKELDKKQYSPIASAPEDIELSDSISGIADSDTCIPKAKYGGINDSLGTCGNSSHSAQSSSTNKTKKLRPLPDISAFDSGSYAAGSMVYNVDSGDHVNESGNSAQQFCPPTPLRTPAWAHRHGLHRSNSLVSSKVLAAVPPQVIDGFSSLENSLVEDGKNKSVTFPSSTHSIDESFSPILEEHHFNDGSPKVDIKARLSLPILRKLIEAPKESRHTPASAFKAITMDPSIGDERATVSFLDDFDNVTKLGSGTFADVYKARFKSDGHFYAIKRNKRQFRGRKDRERTLVEIHIMQRLQNISLSEWRDGNVSSKSSYCLYLLFFIRAWQENGHLFSQTELCCIHTCRHLMMNLTMHWNTASQIYPSLKESSLELSPRTGEHLVPENTIWKICHDVSCGMSHIHSHNIVHHDIKPLNIFFVLHPKLGALCKLGDFGMAGETGTVDDGQEGDPAYMPQELLDCDKKDPSGDVFSLGITLYELATPGYWIAPVDGSKWHEIRSEDHKPEIPNSRSPELVNLIKRMISPFKDKRPTADDILNDNGFINEAAIQEDKFLANYINDVDNVEKEKESETLKALARENNRQTPTPLQNRSSMRTPTPSSGPFP